jgi:UDP-N-acetylmuramoyl-tripeptide--D-alanyl-D-alanine ligase
LGDFARWQRRRQEALVIGVTGSVGKTTTRTLIHAALGGQYDGVQSPRNYNNEIGVPLTLLDLHRGHEFAVLEMGAGRIGDIRTLADIAEPEVGVITAIGLAHVQGFGSEQAIIQGKGELLEALPQSGFAVLPGDDSRLKSMAQRAACPTIFVGEADTNKLRAQDVVARAAHLSFTVDKQRYEIAATGRHFLTGALCAIAVAREVGLSPRNIAEGLRTFQPVGGRSCIVRIGSWTVIDDTYNANPSSMQAACRVVRELDFGAVNHRLLVFGDMLELGAETISAHRQLGAAAAKTGADYLLACGDQAEQVARGAIEAGLSRHRIARCRDLESLLTVLDCWLEPQDVLLVKGSRGMRMERVIEWLRRRVEEKQETNQPEFRKAVA